MPDVRSHDVIDGQCLLDDLSLVGRLHYSSHGFIDRQFFIPLHWVRHVLPVLTDTVQSRDYRKLGSITTVCR